MMLCGIVLIGVFVVKKGYSVRDIFGPSRGAEYERFDREEWVKEQNKEDLVLLMLRDDDRSARLLKAIEVIEGNRLKGSSGWLLGLEDASNVLIDCISQNPNPDEVSENFRRAHEKFGNSVLYKLVKAGFPKISIDDTSKTSVQDKINDLHTAAQSIGIAVPSRIESAESLQDEVTSLSNGPSRTSSEISLDSVGALHAVEAQVRVLMNPEASIDAQNNAIQQIAVELTQQTTALDRILAIISGGMICTSVCMAAGVIAPPLFFKYVFLSVALAGFAKRHVAQSRALKNMCNRISIILDRMEGVEQMSGSVRRVRRVIALLDDKIKQLTESPVLNEATDFLQLGWWLS